VGQQEEIDSAESEINFFELIPKVIEPLSSGTLEEAKKLVNKVFPLQTEEENSDKWLTFSLEQREKNQDAGREYSNKPGYWVFLKGKKVVGIIGLYEYGRNAKNVSWLGWFCVDPAFRKRGIGSELLEYAIAAAKKSGKKRLRLYTTNDPNEADAQKLYEKYGFLVTKKNAGKRGKYTVFHRELVLV